MQNLISVLTSLLLLGGACPRDNPANPKGGGQWDQGVDLETLLAPETDTHTWWMQELDLITARLRALKDAGVVMLWRPFHEMNGG